MGALIPVSVQPRLNWEAVEQLSLALYERRELPRESRPIADRLAKLVAWSGVSLAANTDRFITDVRQEFNARMHIGINLAELDPRLQDYLYLKIRRRRNELLSRFVH